MERVVIYTAIFGNYDVLMQPEYVPRGVDHICFTDDANLEGGVWDIRLLNECDSPRVQAFKPRILPHRYLKEYDYSIYVDGHLYIKSDLTELIKKSNSNIAAVNHNYRDCAYDEADAVVENGRANAQVVRQQMNRYKSEGFPKSYGLSNNGLLIRKHNDKKVIEVMELWWEEFQRGAKRSQLSFEYALWKHGIPVDRLDISRYNSKYFKKFWHKPTGILGDVYEFRINAFQNYAQSRHKIYIYYFYFIYSLLTVLLYMSSGRVTALAGLIFSKLR